MQRSDTLLVTNIRPNILIAHNAIVSYNDGILELHSTCSTIREITDVLHDCKISFLSTNEHQSALDML